MSGDSALRVGSLAGAIRLGQYGVHFVPASPAIADLKREITDPLRLRSGSSTGFGTGAIRQRARASSSR
jgi:hypothetical protein